MLQKVGLLLGGALGFVGFLPLLAGVAEALPLLATVLQSAPGLFPEGPEVNHAFLKILQRDLRPPPARKDAQRPIRLPQEACPALPQNPSPCLPSSLPDMTPAAPTAPRAKRTQTASLTAACDMVPSPTTAPTAHASQRRNCGASCAVRPSPGPPSSRPGPCYDAFHRRCTARGVNPSPSNSPVRGSNRNA